MEGELRKVSEKGDIQAVEHVLDQGEQLDMEAVGKNDLVSLSNYIRVL